MDTVHLIRTSLEKILKDALETDAERAKFASVAIEQLNKFDSASEGKDWEERAQELASIATVKPPELEETDNEGYARFVHHLVKFGECFGMFMDDPVGSHVLIGGALSVMRDIAVEKNKVEWLPKALDLIMLQSVAQLRAGLGTMAQIQLSTILELVALTASDAEALKLHGIRSEDIGDLQNDIALRAAPSALVLAEIFRQENDRSKELASRDLAKVLLAELIAEKDGPFPGNILDRASAMITLAELHITADELNRAAALLDSTMNFLDAAEKDEGGTVGVREYFFSCAHQRRAELYAVAENWPLAIAHYKQSVKFIRRSISSNTLNSHYLDHRADLLNELGILYGMSGDFLTSQSTLIEAIDRKRALSEKSNRYRAGLIACLHNMSILMRKMGKHEVAFAYLEEALEEIDNLPGEHISGYEDIRGTVSKGMEIMKHIHKERQEMNPWGVKKKDDVGPN